MAREEKLENQLNRIWINHKNLTSHRFKIWLPRYQASKLSIKGLYVLKRWRK